jgi:hypothetical protein
VNEWGLPALLLIGLGYRLATLALKDVYPF